MDVDGNPIYSQGGGIFKFGDTYYWYGVKYAEAVKYEKNPVVSSSSRSNQTTFMTVTCYSSKDLVNWKFENDVVTINTNRGEKSVTLLRNGVSTNIFSATQKGSTFFQLAIGDNPFGYLADNGSSNDSVNIAIKHNTLYRGV